MDYLFFASCSKGVEDLLQSELEHLGLPGLSIGNGGVHFSGSLEGAYRACLWSRLASRILLKLAEFTVADEDQLYNAIQHIDWSEHMAVSDSFAIDCFSSHSQISNSHYATLRIKDAIVDQFKEKTGIRPDVVRERPSIRVNVYITEQKVITYLDLSGEALHRRGYRQRGGIAPLRETLAAAILYRAKWRDFARRGDPLFDPMCGSATLLIEAAMMTADMAPGLLRDYYGFMGWQQFDEKQWQVIIQQAKDGLDERIEQLPTIIGCDYSASILAIAQQNIQAAGLSAKIKLEQMDTTTAMPAMVSSNGLIITNPPYGKRLGQVQPLRTLYLRLGKMLKQAFPGWTAVIFTSEESLAKNISLRSFHKNSLYNGAIKCTLYQYHLNTIEHGCEAEPGQIKTGQIENGQIENGQIKNNGRVKNKGSEQPLAANKVQTPVKVLPPEINEHALMYVNRLKKNAKHIKKWAHKNSVSCYRVYDADIPQYAVAIDIYEDWVHIQEYEAPKTVDQAKAGKRLNDIIDVTAQVLGIAQEKVVLKVRKKQSGRQQYTKQDNKGRMITVHESDLLFRVNLYDYLDTGLFLDHRLTRQIIYRLAKAKNVLNLFAYTGSASVYAAAGGAKTTTTVDMSNTYLQWAEDNFRCNHLSGKKHRFIRADCMQWLWDAKRAGEVFDLIFLDPPTFSNSTKMQQAFDIRRDHVSLLKQVMGLLSHNGQLIFSTNARKFTLDKTLQDEFAVREITALTLTEDFRRRSLHQCWCLAHQEEQVEAALFKL